MYEAFICHLCMYEKGVRILLKGYLLISPLPLLNCKRYWETLKRQFKR